MSFEKLFERRLSHGLCVAVSLPQRGTPLDTHDLAPLDFEERTHADALPPLRRTSFVGGRRAMRQALATIAHDAPAILATPRGAPLLPDSVRGSISHKDSIAVALVALSTDDGNASPRHVGIDVELDAPRATDVSRHVLVDAEIARLAHLPDDERLRVVTLHFSIKEAIYKAIDPFVQRYVGFHEVEVEPLVGGTVRVVMALKNGEGPFEVDAWWEREGGLILTTARARRLTF